MSEAFIRWGMGYVVLLLFYVLQLNPYLFGRVFTVSKSSSAVAVVGCFDARRGGTVFELCDEKVKPGMNVLLDRRTGDRARRKPLLLLLSLVFPFVFSMIIRWWYKPDGRAWRLGHDGYWPRIR
jgi:hypothetical protein